MSRPGDLRLLHPSPAMVMREAASHCHIQAQKGAVMDAFTWTMRVWRNNVLITTWSCSDDETMQVAVEDSVTAMLEWNGSSSADLITHLEFAGAGLGAGTASCGADRVSYRLERSTAVGAGIGYLEAAGLARRRGDHESWRTLIAWARAAPAPSLP